MNKKKKEQNTVFYKITFSCSLTGFVLSIFPPPCFFLPSSIWLLKNSQNHLEDIASNKILTFLLIALSCHTAKYFLTSLATEPTPPCNCRNDKFILCFSSNANDVKASVYKNMSVRIRNFINNIKKLASTSKKKLLLILVLLIINTYKIRFSSMYGPN